MSTTTRSASDVPGHGPNGAVDDASRYYPRLTDEQMRCIERFATCRELASGEMLFDHGQTDAPFFVLQEGRVDFFDRRPDGDEHFLSLNAPVFIGDIAMFTGEPTIAACVAAKPCKALRLEREDLRQLVAQFSDIGDTILTALLNRRHWLEHHQHGQMQLIGSRNSRETFELRDFLTRNQMPFEWHDPDADETTRTLLDHFGIPADQTPVLIAGARVCRKPTVEDVADELNLRPTLHEAPYDLVVVGAGPAGLAAAVYAASEGLQTLLLDGDSPGGQAGASTKIENYLGFATGISGAELARQAVLQARKFGATISNPTSVTSLDCGKTVKRLKLADGRHVQARSVVLATGAEYRRLDGPGFDRFEGSGVYYTAGHPEAVQCTGSDVIVVGGGNSAGQAAVHMSQHVHKVYVVIRGESLAESMSQYLISRLEKARNIEVVPRTEVVAVDGGDYVERATLRDAEGQERQVKTAGVFVMIGARPRTQWLVECDCVGLDDNGFVITGGDARRHERFGAHWSADREPYFLETTRPGVFAVGDVRAGSIKRVASAVGEGSMAVKYIHEVLAAQEV